LKQEKVQADGDTQKLQTISYERTAIRVKRLQDKDCY